MPGRAWPKGDWRWLTASSCGRTEGTRGDRWLLGSSPVLLRARSWDQDRTFPGPGGRALWAAGGVSAGGRVAGLFRACPGGGPGPGCGAYRAAPSCAGCPQRERVVKYVIALVVFLL